MPVCITGMHRSGTSMIAGVLNGCGLYLGSENDLMPPQIDNQEGFYENLRFTKLNDHVLNSVGAGWDYFPNLADGWEKSAKLAPLVQSGLDLIDEFSEHEPWGWKDPRNSLTYPFWKLINNDIKVVICVRNPLEVAESLKRRGNSSINFGLDLWQKYNKTLLASVDAQKYVVTHYNSFFDNPQLEIERLLDFLEVSASPETIKSSFSTIVSSLHHNRRKLEELFEIDSLQKGEIIETYLRLCKQAGVEYSSVAQVNINDDSDLDVLDQTLKQVEDNHLTTVITELKMENKNLSQIVAQRDEVIRAKNGLIKNLNNTIDDLYRSKSWRLTVPVRATSDFLRRAIKSFLAQIRRVYNKLPISFGKKLAIKNLLLRYFGFFLKRIIWGGEIDGLSVQKQIAEVLKSIEFSSIDEARGRLLETFSKEPSGQPTVSIVIPVFNHVEYTVRCLLSIAALGTAIPYELIVIDDNSSDATRSVLGECKGFHYVQNEKNLGFLKSCNKAAALAKGQYILLLNNDTVVLPNWLDSLVSTFTEFPRAGLVGSKLIYPDGTLQEAGGIIWSDGSGWNYGRGDDPNKPKYNYLREVDYCSGASIIIPKQVWVEMKGFDEFFCPAYYEDTDIAFRIRQAGYGVFYQPASYVVHFEGISSGKDVKNGVKSYQEINKEKFLARWETILAEYETSSTLKEFAFRNRYANGQILYVDATTPTPDQDSGSVDAYNFLRLFKKMGFETSFIPATNLKYLGKYTHDLQQKGIECQYGPYTTSIKDFIVQNPDRFDIAILSRFPIANEYLNVIRSKIPHAKIIFNTVDLHFLRSEREASVKGNRNDSQIQKMKEGEIGLMKKSDHTIVVSEEELRLIHSIDPEIPVSVIPLPRDVPGRNNGYKPRRNIVFIGGYGHPPNIDAVHYFINEIWPLISKRIPSAKFIIAGSDMPESFDQYAGEKVLLRGFVENLEDLFDHCRLSVAPLRYGAGVKGKVVTSLSYGVPCVVTPMAMEGMGLVDGENILCASTPEEFADSVEKLYSSADLWYQLSDNGITLVREKYSIESIEHKLSAVINNL